MFTGIVTDLGQVRAVEGGGETRLTIATGADKKSVDGTFVDGGVSPFNNPSLQAVMYAALAGHGVNWTTGADRLLLVSVGTGTSSPALK